MCLGSCPRPLIVIVLELELVLGSVILGLKVEAGLLPDNACGSPPVAKLKAEDEFEFD
jgi:hypothetical protein